MPLHRANPAHRPWLFHSRCAASVLLILSMAAMQSSVRAQAPGAIGQPNDLPEFSSETGRFDWTGREIPTCGFVGHGLEQVDGVVTQIVRESGLPGAAFAISSKGQLIFSRGYGFADYEKQTPFTPDTLCRVASVSKPITNEVAQTLIRAGVITEHEAVVPYLKSKGMTPLPGPDHPADPRIDQITVRQLLDHTSGIETGTTQIELEFASPEVAAHYGFNTSLTEDQSIQLILGRPLMHSPGQQQEYSNWGYDVLGRFLALKIQDRYHESYEQFARESVIRLHGDPTDLRLVSGRREDLLFNEATCYRAFKDDATGKYALDFATFNLKAHKGSAGWAGSANALARYFNGLQTRNWTYVFFGSLPGNHAMFRTFPQGLTFAFVTNFNPDGVDPTTLIQDRVAPMIERFLKR